ncbi:protein TolQ [uncultured Ferrovibrio sp.]|jgi:biopolymer transport protein TolQ|uniref:protein TolQ n=1 Tax=uncultured Ferrovibrio sp. TaxID=1576913 RepID=UPI00262043D1|nr:protein TolQ [uncultured Ferrovibrio sp.]
MDRTVSAMPLGGSSVASDLSLWTLFLQADWIVKAVMLMLVLASFWSWAIIFDKLIKIRKVIADTDKFETDFWSGGSLDALYDRLSISGPQHPMAVLFLAAMREWRRSTERGLVRGKQGLGSLQVRIGQVMRVSIDREMERLERYLGFLASVGSVSPFVGLFGTVWGIMNSFHAIASSKNTSLAVVAPGIAEALFATALGLLAAIPAVMAYNKFSNDLSRLSVRLEGFAGEFSALMSRQLDEEAA